MKKIKALFVILMVFTMAFGLAACGTGTSKETSNTSAAESKTDSVETTPAAEPASDSVETKESSEPVADSAEPEEPSENASEDAVSVSEESTPEDVAVHSDVLVAYFSATGTTKGVAERIASITGGDLYEILAAEPYTAEDLNYNDSSSRSTIEQNDKNVRPEIGSEEISLEGYTTVYLGFPIWWGEEPRILDTFVEKYSFEGITVIPFCTSASSGIGRSGPNMEALAGSGTWLDGKRFDGNVSETDLQSWIESLK